MSMRLAAACGWMALGCIPVVLVGLVSLAIHASFKSLDVRVTGLEQRIQTAGLTAANTTTTSSVADHSIGSGNASDAIVAGPGSQTILWITPDMQVHVAEGWTLERALQAMFDQIRKDCLVQQEKQ